MQKVKHGLLGRWFIFAILLWTVALDAASSSEEILCDQVANYTMDVRLDTQTHMISGKEILHWTNTSDKPAEELWFHLYWNAFQNSQSTFIQERVRDGRTAPDLSKGEWGYCRITSIRMVSSETNEEFDLTPFLEFRQPDDENILDQTVFSAELPEALKPEESITLLIDFSAQVPRPLSRTGVFRETYFVAQWFPKIGVYQDGKWNCHQYHAHSEYFADYGTYDVKLTAPSSFIVGATGELREKKPNSDGTTTHRYVQHSIHDFAWTASPHYLEYKEDYAYTPGKEAEITLLLQPHHKKLKARYLNAVKHALRYASQWYGNYPYTTVTCVDPAYNSRSGGMEYPTFFTGGAHFLDCPGSGDPETVIIHEFGHGYFYGLVGSNEFENAWMDEGFTSFLDTEIYYAAYGDPYLSRRYFGFPVLFKKVKIPIELDESRQISFLRRTGDMDKMQRFSWEFMNGESYTTNAYYKPELMLRTLQRFLGKDRFSRLIKDYSERWWFKHPKPQDFYQTVSEHAGEDMSWFLDQFVYGSGCLDYAVTSIQNHEKESLQGWFDGSYHKNDSETEAAPVFESEVLVRRLGEVKLPVEVLVHFSDGQEFRGIWDGQYRWKRFTFTGPVRVEKAVVDPEFKLVLDRNRTNNSYTLNPNKLAPWKWTAKWLFWLQHALEVLRVFGS